MKPSGARSCSRRAALALLFAPAIGPVRGAAAASELPPDIVLLRRRGLQLPVAGVTAEQLVDTYTQARAGSTGRHDAIDIPAPRGTPVLAVADGTVKKLFLSKPGGLTLYQFDDSASFSFYYAHLDRYADSIREGQRLRKGQVIGFVGSTGNAPAQAPHLHFAVLRLGLEPKWWEGTPLNPFLLWRDPAPAR